MAFDITKTVTVIKLRANNDRNGNPRRVFLAIDSGGFTKGYDEGYDGKAALPASIRGLYQGVVIDVEPAEYSFRVAGDLTADEISEDAFILKDNPRHGYGYEILNEGGLVDVADTWDDAIQIIADTMEEQQYWPDVYYVNDHGNVEQLILTEAE